MANFLLVDQRFTIDSVMKIAFPLGHEWECFTLLEFSGNNLISAIS